MGAFLAASKLQEVVPSLTQNCASATNKESKYTIEMLSSTLREQVIRYLNCLHFNTINYRLNETSLLYLWFQNHLYEFLGERRTGTVDERYLRRL